VKKRTNKWDEVEQPERRRPRDMAAGHERDEVSRKVKDQLEEEIEELEKETQTIPLDLSKLAPDREIIQVLPSQGVNGALVDYEYCWVRFKSDRGPSSLQVDQKLFWQVKEDGSTVPVWEVVKGGPTDTRFPEAMERRDVNGYRVIGDTLLMRARKDRYAALQMHFEFEHEKRMGTEAKTIQDFAEQKKIKMFNFDSTKGLDERGMLAAKSAVSNMKRNHRLDLSAAQAIIDDAERNGGNTALLKHGLKQMLAMQVAQDYVAKRIREGTLHFKGD
jgi:hypothetical protein